MRKCSTLVSMGKLLKPKFSLRLTLFLLVCLIISIFLNIFLIYQNLERSRVTRVVDGDSLELSDGRRIRLLGLDAPEKGRCMGTEARERLKALAANRFVRLKDEVTDDYGRILANVILHPTLYEWREYLWQRFIVKSESLKTPFLNGTMVMEGLARFNSVASPYKEILTQAQEKARREKRGIWSEACRQTTPETDCLIKGNIRAEEKIYHLPDCPNYPEVIIDQSFGDQWFCTEEEAASQGFRKAQGC